MLITVTGPDPKRFKAGYSPSHINDHGNTTITCTGIRITEDLVITSALSLYAFLSVSARSSLQTATHTDLIPGTTLCAASFHASQDPSSCNTTPPSNAGNNRSTTEFKAKLVCLLHNQDFHEALQRVLVSPALNAAQWRLQYTAQETQVPVSLVSYIAVLQLDTSHTLEKRDVSELDVDVDVSLLLSQYSTSNIWRANSTSAGASPELGSEIVVIGHPFAPLDKGLRFQGCISRGVIASLVNAPRSNGQRSQSGTIHKMIAPDLILADIKTLPGMEGSPVFLNTANGINCISLSSSSLLNPKVSESLIGMLLPPLAAPELQASFQLVMPLHSILQHRRLLLMLAQHKTQHPAGQQLSSALTSTTDVSSGTDSSENSTTVNSIDDAVMFSRNGLAAKEGRLALHGIVAVLSAGGWASGILIDEVGHIVTCTHALKGHTPGTRVHVSISKRKDREVRSWEPAEVVHVFTGALDLALIKLQRSTRIKTRDNFHDYERTNNTNNNSSSDIETLSSSFSSCVVPSVGMAVQVVGFPIFHPRSGLGPICTTGNIAKINTVSIHATTTPSLNNNSVESRRAVPAMLITTASVISGVSGGAVVESTTGKLLGMVTSNAKLHQHQLYPELNFCIPTSLLELAVNGVVYGDSGSTSLLEQLEPQLMRLWNLASGFGTETRPETKQEEFLKKLLHEASKL